VGYNALVFRDLDDGFVSRVNAASIVMLNDLANQAIGVDDKIDFDAFVETIRSREIVKRTASNVQQETTAETWRGARKSGAVAVLCTPN
jgi:hypothetical protein